MFTLDQIKTEHSKVKSGADFPAYIRRIKELGVTYYETFVSDGHTEFAGADDYKISSAAKYDVLQIDDRLQEEKFKSDLRTHQQGVTDYPTFCRECADSGIWKWAVCLEKMTCTYFDKASNAVLGEVIPTHTT